MHVDVTLRGSISSQAADMARKEVGALERVVKGPLTDARVVLTQEENPRIESPARAEGEVVLAGQAVRACVACPTMVAAVDEMAERLHDQLRRHVERLITQQRGTATLEPGQWRHATWTPPRASRSWRPPAERRMVRRKTFGLASVSIAEAAADLAALDHSFYLFHDADTGADEVLYRRDDGRLAVLEPHDAPAMAAEEGVVREVSRFSAPIELSTAVGEMDALNHRFLYFTDASSRRGCVLYLRHDGHYGLIEPAG
jgi:ribosome-associated translation inhibitor RaiA